jgi:hypothetical protein
VTILNEDFFVKQRELMRQKRMRSSMKNLKLPLQPDGNLDTIEEEQHTKVLDMDLNYMLQQEVSIEKGRLVNQVRLSETESEEEFQTPHHPRSMLKDLQ